MTMIIILFLRDVGAGLHAGMPRDLLLRGLAGSAEPWQAGCLPSKLPKLPLSRPDGSTIALIVPWDQVLLSSQKNLKEKK